MGRLPQEHCNLNFNETVTSWDEAVPLGNGHIGALVWGAPDALRFSLDRTDIWDKTPFAGISGSEFTYKNMVRLAKEGNVDEITRIFDAPYNCVTPSKLPAGKLILNFGTDSPVKSTLCLATASAELTFGDVRLQGFVHAEKNLGIIKVNLPMSEFSFEIENPEFNIKGTGESHTLGAVATNTASLKQLYYHAPKRGVCRDFAYFVQEVDAGFSFGAFAAAKEIDGDTVIAFTVSCTNDGEAYAEGAAALLENALREGYEQLFGEHCAWWQGYWGKSSLSLPDKFYEKNWYLANYLLASCSRKGGYPMPLQGVWTADNGQLPPWKGDYHHDLNTQLSYYSYLKANHMDEGESFIDFLWGHADTARRFARRFYGAKGLCLPSVMTIDGAPLGGWAMYALSPTNQLWLCQAFERHYRFSGDEQFLKTKAYPYMRETAEFILCLLEEKDGLLYLPVSSSPEIHDNTLDAFVTPNSNYDLALLRYLFTQLAELAVLLDNGEHDRWNVVLQKLPQLAVNESNVLMVSPTESLQESHRHFSHLMAIHPLRLVRYTTDESKKLIDACVADIERLGTGCWTGYSVAWFAELYAVQQNGNGAAYQLRSFWENFCSQNGFHLNGDYKNRGVSGLHYRPFTLEGNFCAADVLQEMLLQSGNGMLELFPAIPDEWRDKDMAFEDFRTENGLLVSATMENGRLKGLRLFPEHSCEVYIVNLSKTLQLEAGQEMIVL